MPPTMEIFKQKGAGKRNPRGKTDGYVGTATAPGDAIQTDRAKCRKNKPEKRADLTDNTTSATNCSTRTNG